MVYEAFQISKNMDWLDMHKTTIRNCRNWYDKHVNRRGLIQEIPFGYWEDSLMLSPLIPYTNLLYLKALKCASELLDTPYQIYSDLKRRVTNLVLDKTKLGGLDTVSGWNWAWVGCLFCAALARRNFKVAARRRFGIYERLVSIYGTLHEVYEDFKPVRRSLYTSEECFSEALGCYLFAKNMMYK